MIEWIRGHPLESGLFGGIALLGVVLGVVSLVSSASDPDPSPPTTAFEVGSGDGTIPTDPIDTFDASAHPEIEQFTCTGFITIDDADYAFGIEGQLAAVMNLERGETCTDFLADDQSVWVRIEPGAPDDFSPGATLEGAQGSPVTAVGHDAVWFPGEEVSVITVFQRVELGGLYYRILLSRPDLAPEMEREILIELALRALPRFPGVVEEQPEPVEITVDIETADPATIGHAGNVLAREADGEWTRGEGLIATLQLFAGESDVGDVLRFPDVVELDRSAVVALARDYVASADDDDQAAGEILRLLHRLVPTIRALEEAGDIDIAKPTNAIQAVLVGLVLNQEGEDPAISSFCLLNFGTSPCMDVTEVEGSPYTLYTLKPEFEGAWDPTQVGFALDAMSEAAAVLEEVGPTPVTRVILNPHAVGVVVLADGGEYIAHVGTDMIGQQPVTLKHAVAYAIAKAMVEASHGEEAWFSSGLAMYLSGVVHPDYNYEHGLVTLLAGLEISAPLTEWGAAAWIFFEYLHGEIGDAGPVFNFPQLSPSQLSAHFHGFAEALTDGLVPDIGILFDYVPYAAQFWDLPVTVPFSVDLAPPPFGIRRIQLAVEPGEHACLDIISSGPIRVSWRPGTEEGGYRAPWESEPPAAIEGSSTLLITASGEGFYDLAVTRFVDDPDECTDPPPEPAAPAPLDTECPVLCDPTEFLWNPNTIHIEVDIP